MECHELSIANKRSTDKRQDTKRSRHTVQPAETKSKAGFLTGEEPMGPVRRCSKSLGSSRVRAEGVRSITGRVGSGRVGSGRVGSGRVGSGRVGSRQEVFQISRTGPGWFGLGRVRLGDFQISRVESGQKVLKISRVWSGRVGSGRVRSGGFQISPEPGHDRTRGRVGSGQQVFKISVVGSRVGSGLQRTGILAGSLARRDTLPGDMYCQ